MLNGSPPICAHLPVDQLAAGAQPAQLGQRVHLVAGGDRRVGGEHDLLAHRRPGLDERRAGDHALRDQLDAGERRVSLVEVVGVDVDAELAQRAHAADAEQDLLRDAAVERRIVEAVRDPGVAGARPARGAGAARCPSARCARRAPRPRASRPARAPGRRCPRGSPRGSSGTPRRAGRPRRSAGGSSRAPSAVPTPTTGRPRSCADLMKSPARMPRPPA